MTSAQPSTTAGPLPMPTTTVSDLLVLGRLALIDPATGPFVAPPEGVGNPRLVDCRVLGKGILNGVQIGTQGWRPGMAGHPWMMLGAFKKKAAYKELSRAWEDWEGRFYLGLSTATNAAIDLHGWAIDWEAQLQQWFPFHRRFNAPALVAGDCYWQYEGGEAAPFQLGEWRGYGYVGTLLIHNVVGITWGV